MSVFAALVLSWCVAAVLALVVDRSHAVFTPVVLVRLLTAAAVVLAAATTMSVLAAICVLGSAGVAGKVGAAVLAGLLVAAVTRAVRHALRVAASLRAAAVFRGSALRTGDLLIVDDELPDAFAVPGRGAVVVATTGLRSALSAEEFAAVVRHERAHLRARHHVYIHAVELAACLNPLLSRWPAAVRFAAERQADECAARLGRPTVARAVARAALVCVRSEQPAALSIVGVPGEAVRRVRALQRPRPRPQRRWVLAVAVAVMLALNLNILATADLAQDRIVAETTEPASAALG